MSKIKILIAYDDMNVAEDIGTYIGRLEYVEVVGYTKTGNEIYNKIIELKPDIVFMQYNIQSMEVMEKIEEELKEETPEFKFIAEDLSKHITSNRYEEKNNMNALVKEFGKNGMLEVLKNYQERENINFQKK